MYEHCTVRKSREIVNGVLKRRGKSHSDVKNGCHGNAARGKQMSKSTATFKNNRNKVLIDN